MRSPESQKKSQSKPVNVTRELAKAQRKLARINQREQEKKAVKQRVKATKTFTGFITDTYESVTGEKINV